MDQLFPVYPFIVHTVPDGRTCNDVLEEKIRNYHEMLCLAEEFSYMSKMLIQVAALLAMQCHFNHFRGGKRRPHYSIHLLRVAQRISKHFSQIVSASTDKSSEFGGIEPKALVIAVGLLHDSLEDFAENFKASNQPISTEVGRKAANHYLRAKLGEIVGTEVSHKIVDYIEILTNNNPDEFPDTEYLARISRSPYTLAVKLADIDHNLTTFPAFSPIYSSLVTPCQYLDLANGTVYETSYIESLLLNFAVVSLDEPCPWIPDSRVRTTDIVLGQVQRYEGNTGLERMVTHYTMLIGKIRTECYTQFLTTHNTNSDHVIKQVGLLRSLTNRFKA